MNEVKNSAVANLGEIEAYVPPVVRVMSESEVLSAFQVNAAGTMAWWVA